MSEENVEVVRGYFESLNRWLASYWSDPVVPIEQSPELEEVFDHLYPEAEWDWLFSPETFRGREQLLQAVAALDEKRRFAWKRGGSRRA
jgi:hypothetical protein